MPTMRGDNPSAQMRHVRRSVKSMQPNVAPAQGIALMVLSIIAFLLWLGVVVTFVKLLMG